MNLLKLFKDIVSDCLDRKISRIVHFMKLFSFVEIKYIVLHCVDPNASGFHLSKFKYWVTGWFNVKLHVYELSYLTKDAAMVCYTWSRVSWACCMHCALQMDFM